VRQRAEGTYAEVRKKGRRGKGEGKSSIIELLATS
jgi:hypothetical protein